MEESRVCRGKPPSAGDWAACAVCVCIRSELPDCAPTFREAFFFNVFRTKVNKELLVLNWRYEKLTFATWQRLVSAHLGTAVAGVCFCNSAAVCYRVLVLGTGLLLGCLEAGGVVFGEVLAVGRVGLAAFKMSGFWTHAGLFDREPRPKTKRHRSQAAKVRRLKN